MGKRTGRSIAAMFIFMGGLFLAAFSAANELSLWVVEQGRARLEFSIAPAKKGALIVDNSAVSIAIDGQESQILARDIEPFNGEIGVIVDDYNFDGLNDIAVLESYGYGGVNLFYAVYVFDLAQSAYRYWLTESNIEPDPATRELHTGQKSGPRYITVIYRIHDGNPYAYRESVGIGLDLEKVTLRNEYGDVIQTNIADVRLDGSAAAIRAIAAERAYFFDEPNETTKTSIYVIRGDKVELLDSAGDWDDWCLIRYRGKRIFEKWIKTADLEE